jgi:hypothetical protein
VSSIETLKDFFQPEQSLQLIKLKSKKTTRPLDPVGSLATLLVVENLLDIEDAANAVRRTPDDLIREAQAWLLGQTLTEETLNDT